MIRHITKLSNSLHKHEQTMLVDNILRFVESVKTKKVSALKYHFNSKLSGFLLPTKQDIVDRYYNFHSDTYLSSRLPI